MVGGRAGTNRRRDCSERKEAPPPVPAQPRSSRGGRLANRTTGRPPKVASSEVGKQRRQSRLEVDDLHASAGPGYEVGNANVEASEPFLEECTRCREPIESPGC